MECLFASRFLSVLFRNKTEESHSYRRAYLKRVCRPRFSFFANDQPVPYGAPAWPVMRQLGVVQGL